MYVRRFLRSVAHPAYTGGAREPGFVVANLLVICLVAVGVESAVPASGAVVVAVGTAFLIVRGYAVPGTPWFLSATSRALDRFATLERPPRDERELLRAGVLTVAGEEVRPSGSFVMAWRQRVRSAGPRHDDGHALAAALGFDAETVAVEPRGELLVAERRGRRLGTWLSRAALVADTASIAELRRRYPEWDLLPPWRRGAMLATIRLYLDVCPVCDGMLVLDRASSRLPDVTDDVVAVTCAGCDARLFESGFATEIAAVDDDTSSSVVGR